MLRTLADAVCRLQLDHPTRVAVDGITASGKTTLADELAQVIASVGRGAVRLSMDGYHHPRRYRYRQGRGSADGYYEDAYDFDSLAALVLRPLGPGGNGIYVPAILDLATDRPPDRIAEPVAADAVLVVDGTFLQRAELDGFWDLRVFVDTDFAVARERGVARDAPALGGEQKAAEAFDHRYHAACRRYLAEVDPVQRADVVVTNDDLEMPVLRTG